MCSYQIVSLEKLVPAKHMYRRFKELWDFKNIEEKLDKVAGSSRYEGYGIFCLFMCLLLQFMEDLSDRE